MVEATNKNTTPVEAAAPAKPVVQLPSAISVCDLAAQLRVSSIDVIKQLMRKGVMANINQVIDYDMAKAVAAELGYEAKPASLKAREARRLPREKFSGLPVRPPVVTIMGHVDHGKTKLLDAIRHSNVVDSEVGGITQHIGAYQVEFNGHKLTFLDTPGHEAFTAMRARGAQATDITVLVVAADDGVMPQTLEALDHARAAAVPIIVAINKIDKAGANPDHVKQQLADAGLVVEDWGGETLAVPTSAREGKGIKELLEDILLVAEMEDLRADPDQPASGVVIEAEMDKTRGPMATLLVQAGTLKLGDTVVAGTTWGNVKAMFNDAGKRLKKAEPSSPVALLGLESVPGVGDKFSVVSSEKQAREQVLAAQGQAKRQAAGGISLSNVYDQISTGKIKELNVVLKADVQGSIEPIRTSLERLGSDKLAVRVIHSGTGNINESDVMLAAASHGLVLGFSTAVEPGAARLAESEKVDIRHYDIIYKLIEDVDKALKGMLEPTFAEVVEGRAETKAVFPSGRKTNVAGVLVTDGRATRGAQVRVKRANKIVADSTVESLRRFKEDVREIASGYEGGVGVKDFNAFQVGDILEFYRKERVG